MLSLLVAVLSSSCRGERPEAEPPALAYSVSDGDCLGRCPIGTVVSVFVRDRAGQPISGAAVVLIPIANDGPGGFGDCSGIAARPTGGATDETGRFVGEIKGISTPLFGSPVCVVIATTPPSGTTEDVVLTTRERIPLRFAAGVPTDTVEIEVVLN